MRLPPPPPDYDAEDQAQMRRDLETADGKNMKLNAVFEKLQFRDTVTGKIVVLTVASGAPVWTVL